MSTTEIVKAQEPEVLIRLAIEKGADLDKLEKVMALQERHNANIARQAYNEAMTAFKADPPKINKDKKVGYSTDKGKVGYSHASLYNVTQKIGEALAKHGLSASWTTKQNGTISVTCHIAHVLGHREETTLSAPSDASGSKNAIQAIGSTVTYLERYTLLALTGLATVDQDDDGSTAATEFISETELNNVVDLIAEKDINIKKFCEFMKIEALDKMPKAKLQQALKAIEAKKKKAAK